MKKIILVVQIFGVLGLLLNNPTNAESAAVITQVTDSLGNVQTNSWAEDVTYDWPEGVETPIILEIGDVDEPITDPISFEVLASGTGLEYKFGITPTGWFTIPIPGCEGEEGKQGWGSANTCTWDLQKSDYGAEVRVFIAVRDGDGQDHMNDPFNGDDYTTMTYVVDSPPQASMPAYLVNACDNLNNCTDLTFANDEGTGWPYPWPVVYPGDVIDFIVDAKDDDPDQTEITNLSYRFIVAPGGGWYPDDFPWIENSTWTWEVTEDQITDYGLVIIAVTDNDGYDWAGREHGDDYLHMIYTVSSTDNDNDGVNDDLDKCDDTNYGPFPMVVDEDGCSIRDLVPCYGEYPNHGQYMKNLIIVLKKFVSDGLITDAEREMIELEESNSSCGK